MIELKDLTVGYSKDKPLIENINFTFEDNKIYGILGKSGFGKSTLLKTIAGLQKPLYGSIYVDGSIVKNAKTSGSYMMFQNYTCFDWLDCLDNVIIAQKVVSRISEKDIEDAKKWLAAVGLSEDTYKYPTQLSGGMKQRLALARTLFMNPKVVLMDEPLSALDEKTRAAMQNLILEDHKHDKNIIIMITHSHEEAERVCDVVIDFEKGGFKDGIQGFIH